MQTNPCSNETVAEKTVSLILQSTFSDTDVETIVNALKLKRYVLSAVVRKTEQSESFGHFLERFWTFETSPYIAEKRTVGQTIHRRYTETMLSRAKRYWIPRFGKRPLASITQTDIKQMIRFLISVPQAVPTQKKDAYGRRIFVKKQLSAETVNQIVRVATCALKWAYHNSLTENDCFSGIMYCKVIPQKRDVLTLSEAATLFSCEWENERYRLANLTACCTGLRMGEILALQIRDIGVDRIFVQHSWARREGLKCPKNGECRTVKIPQELAFLLHSEAKKNPYGDAPENFLFWGYTQHHPLCPGHLNKALKEMLLHLNISQERRITFHSWRHFFTTNMADNIDERKLQLATGHKSRSMLEHYAAHTSEQALEELGSVAEKLFLPLITGRVA